MGVYDTLYVDYRPMPEGYEKYADEDFQTKDLDRYFEEFHINHLGRLVIRRYDLRDMTPEEAAKHKAFWDGVRAKHPDSQLLSTVDEVEDPPQVRADTYTDVDQNYHGDVHFYTWDDTIEEPVDFIARFTEGLLMWIRPVTKEQLLVHRYDV